MTAVSALDAFQTLLWELDETWRRCDFAARKECLSVFDLCG